MEILLKICGYFESYRVNMAFMFTIRYYYALTFAILSVHFGIFDLYFYLHRFRLQSTYRRETPAQN